MFVSVILFNTTVISALIKMFYKITEDLLNLLAELQALRIKQQL